MKKLIFTIDPRAFDKEKIFRILKALREEETRDLRSQAGDSGEKHDGGRHE